MAVPRPNQGFSLTRFPFHCTSDPYTGKMVVLEAGIAQLAIPLAWMRSPALLVYGQWHNL